MFYIKVAVERAGVLGTELPAPSANGLVGDPDSTLSQEILDVSGAQAESVLEPNDMADYLGRESVAAVAGCDGVHGPTLPLIGST